jgi:hypothetical protein
MVPVSRLTGRKDLIEPTVDSQGPCGCVLLWLMCDGRLPTDLRRLVSEQGHVSVSGAVTAVG